MASPSVEQGGGRRVFPAFRELLELDDIVDLGPHRDVRHALEDHLDDDRHAVLLHPLLRLPDRRDAMSVCSGGVVVVEVERHVVYLVGAALCFLIMRRHALLTTMWM